MIKLAQLRKIPMLASKIKISSVSLEEEALEVVEEEEMSTKKT
jgi:hypothetical protein